MEQLGSLILVPLLACLASLLLCRAAMGWALRLGFLDRPGSEAHKQQARAVPYGGGPAVALAMLIALAAGAAWHGLPLLAPGPDRGPLWPVLAGAAVLLLTGLADDRRPLSPRAKLLVQAAVAAAVVPLAGLEVDSLRQWPLLAFAASWAWLVLVSNAFNLLDHADGLSASTAVISATVLLSGALLMGDLPLASVLIALIAGLLGFLVWNLPPARIYLGDAGSLPLGFLIGSASLSVTFWPSGQGASPLALLGPLLITALPLFDTAAVVVKRLRRGRPILKGDRNHLSHRLARLGLSPRASLGVAVALQTALAASALQLRDGAADSAAIAVLQAAGILLVVVLLETSRDDGV